MTSRCLTAVPTRRQTIKNLATFYALTISNYIFPLILLPYLARVLRSQEFGALAMVQSLALSFSLIIDYGFGLSATREVSRHRRNTKKLCHIVASVAAARLLLTAAVLLLAAGLQKLIPAFTQRPLLFWSGILFAAAMAWSPIWYFQGRERVSKLVMLEIAAKSIATLAVFLFVHVPQEAYRVLLLQGLGYLTSSAVGWAWAWREVGFLAPRPRHVIEGLRSGFRLFLLRGMISLYTAANSFLLGLFSPPQEVAHFAAAERLTKALASLWDPFNRVFLPQFSWLLGHDKNRAAQVLRMNTLVMLLLGIAAFIMVSLSAPFVVLLVFGPAYEDATPLIRVLAIIVPLIALSNIWGLQWMTAHGLDAHFNVIVATAGALNVGLVWLLAPAYGAFGSAWALVIVEFWVTFGVWFVLRGRRLLPLALPGRASR